MKYNPDDCRKKTAVDSFSREIFYNPPLAGSLQEAGLIALLNRTYEVYECIPEQAVSFLEDELGIPAAVILRVIRDHGMCTMRKKPQYVIRLCMGQVCGRRNMALILQSILEVLGIGHEGSIDPEKTYSSADGKFRVEPTGCVGACGKSPVITVNDELYTSVTPERVRKLILLLI